MREQHRRKNKRRNVLNMIKRAWRDEKLRTTVCVNLAATLERCDEQILPAVYAFVGASFHASPTALGMVTLSRALVQAVTSPVGGALAHYYDRARVICCGCCIWAACTAGFAACSSLWVACGFAAISGLGLTMVIPTSQSLIADLNPAETRGRAFGYLFMTSALGAMFGSLLGTNAGSARPFGWEGWRAAFMIVAALSLVIGLLNWYGSRDPNFQPDGSSTLEAAGQKSKRNLRAETLKILQMPTFLIIVIQGILGSVPWSAMNFFTFFLQLKGMSNLAASVLIGCFLGANAAGGLLGGWVGDRAARVYPNHGRILITQFSVLVGVPFSLLMIKVLPYSGSPASIAWHALLLVSAGVLKTWAQPGLNNPVFSEIVPPSMRTMIFAFDRCFEGAVAAFATPFVGLLAEKVFGFDGIAEKTGDRETDLRKAHALGSALLCFMAIPWTCCFILYSGLHLTYPRDRRRQALVTADNVVDLTSEHNTLLPPPPWEASSHLEQHRQAVADPANEQQQA
ncbi:hypothetical protein WJX72_008508 [[Myrmecia] bisecta]|uniref:Major facilitator superfamily (MFS) profile domain-containing protein n=1 Tax=[Myrmecia] bisecta TaxID=41462 RepID=A0AAW1QFN9_9CHLO